MKLLFFVGEFSDGGAERVISILANNLVKDFDIEILTYYKTNIFYSLDERISIKCVEANTNTGNRFKNLKWLKDYFDKNTDIIISFLAPFNMFALMTNSNKPIIVADRNDPNYMPKNSVLRKIRNVLYRKADAVVVQTNRNKEYFAYLGNRVKVIYNPINMNDYLGLALNTIKQNKIVSVGRLAPQKNHKLLIDAFKTVHMKHPDYRLEIYGDGPYRNELSKYIMTLELTDSIFLCGQKKDIYSCIKDAKIYVLSSDYEGMPNSLIEAMCLGLPCISTKVSGATDLIKNKENGLLVEIGDTVQLSDAINFLIDDNETCNKISRKAVNISDELNTDHIVYQWKNVISSTLIRRHYN